MSVSPSAAKPQSFRSRRAISLCTPKGVPSLAEKLYPKMDAIESAKLMEKGLGAAPSEVMLSSSEYPLLVTFNDIKTPASVKRVNPANLEATFGPGYRL